MWLAIAVGGALVVWHNVSRTKHISEEMLRSYREALAEARAKKARELAAQAEDAAREEQQQAAKT